MGFMTMPNFLIIGAARSGTTSLFKYLQQHPQIYTPRLKEPMFFAHENQPPILHGPKGDEQIRHAVTDITQYMSLFQNVKNEKAIGEASPQYLSSRTAHERIRHYIPQAKLIAILRHPVDVAYSGFTQQRRDGREPHADFAHALRDEELREREKWSLTFQYRRRGFNHENLKRYYELFPREQLKVYLFDDLKNDPQQMVRDVFRFLEVDENFVPQTWMTYNMSIVPRSMTFHKIINGPHPIKSTLGMVVPRQLRRRFQQSLNQWNLGTLPPVTTEVRRRLIEEYRQDILQVQDLIGRDLSHWLDD
jgi:hypothetical protein